MSEEDKIYEYLVANSKIKRTPKAIMTEEEFKTKYKYRSWEWPQIGDKVKFKTFLGMFYPYFTNVIQFAIVKFILAGVLFGWRKLKVTIFFTSQCLNGQLKIKNYEIKRLRNRGIFICTSW